jgi:hypothetical protein
MPSAATKVASSRFDGEKTALRLSFSANIGRVKTKYFFG